MMSSIRARAPGWGTRGSYFPTTLPCSTLLCFSLPYRYLLKFSLLIYFLYSSLIFCTLLHTNTLLYCNPFYCTLYSSLLLCLSTEKKVLVKWYLPFSGFQKILAWHFQVLLGLEDHHCIINTSHPRSKQSSRVFFLLPSSCYNGSEEEHAAVLRGGFLTRREASGKRAYQHLFLSKCVVMATVRSPYGVAKSRKTSTATTAQSIINRCLFGFNRHLNDVTAVLHPLGTNAPTQKMVVDALSGKAPLHKNGGPSSSVKYGS